MKKVLVVLTVLALVVISSLAFAAAEVTVGGSVQIRSRDFQNLTFDKSLDSRTTGSKGAVVDTQERIMLDINAKVDGAKAKISLWNDFDDWGRYENVQGNNGFGIASGVTDGHFGFREAWLSVNVPGIPVNVTAGHQLLMLGMGGFFRSMHFGSDAWVVANVTGPNTAALVNIKVSEGVLSTAGSNYVGAAETDDIDDYTLLDVFKINENNTVGIDISHVRVRSGATFTFGTAGLNDATLDNIGMNYTGKLGPVKLQAELDYQMGKIKKAGGAVLSPDRKFKGNQIWVKGNVPMDPVTVNFTIARGTGNKYGNNDIKQFVPLLDVDPHYTFLYEYKTNTACASAFATSGAKNTGFCNTTAFSAGAAIKPIKSLLIGADLWYLQATEKHGTPYAYKTSDAHTSSNVGIEIDAKVQWQLYENVSWNWDLGYFKPGDALKTSATAKTDTVLGAQGVLAIKF